MAVKCLDFELNKQDFGEKIQNAPRFLGVVLPIQTRKDGFDYKALFKRTFYGILIYYFFGLRFFVRK